MNPATLSRRCPVCEQSSAETFLRKGGLTLVRCRHCSMVYANPVPARFASGEYYEEAGADYYLAPAKLESDYAGVRFERELRLFRRHCPRGSVLDVGCSSGAFLFQLRRWHPGAYEILGTDVSGAPLDYAESRGVPVVRGNFPELDFGERRFDAVTFWAVMEHLPEPGRFLERAVSLLHPGGHCFVLVPNLKSLAVRLLGRKYRYILPQHVNYFAPETLRHFAQRQPRFQMVEFRGAHFNPLVIVQDGFRRERAVSDEERANLLKQTTRYKQNPVFRPIGLALAGVETLLSALNLADNLVMVLRKTVV